MSYAKDIPLSYKKKTPARNQSRDGLGINDNPHVFFRFSATLNIGFLFFKKKDFIYFIFREEGKERGRETSMFGCLSRAPYWGPGLQLRHVP